MDIIKNKLKDSKLLIDELYEYFDKLKPLLEKKYPDELKQLNKTILLFPSMVQSINKRQDSLLELLSNKKQAFNTITTSIFDLYASIQDYYHSVQTIVEVLSMPHMHTTNIDDDDWSQTYKIVTADALDALILNYSTFVKKFETNDTETTNVLVKYLLKLVINEDKILNIDQSIEYIKFIQSSFYERSNTVALYCAFCQAYLDEISQIKSQESKVISRFIIDSIESDKDFYLSHMSIAPNKSKKRLNNPLLKRFGLIPATELYPLKKLLELIASSVTTLSKLASSSKTCIIVMKHIVPSPIEYNIKQLIKSTSRVQPALFGITDKLVQRFTTMKQLKDSEYEFSYEIIGNTNSEDFYILETLNNTDYRVLAPWLDSKKYTIGKKYAQQIVQYITTNNADRSTNYQSIMIQKSLKHMFLSKPLGLDSLIEHAKDVDTQIIKNELFLKIKAIIANIIDKHNVTSMHDINDILHNETIKETFVSVILIMYKVASKYTDLQEFDAGKFPFSELFSSFLVELQVITRQFMKNLHDLFNRSLPDESLFTLSKAEKNTKLISILDDILLHALQNVVGDNSNIYSALNYKYLLLNFT